MRRKWRGPEEDTHAKTQRREGRSKMECGTAVWQAGQHARMPECGMRNAEIRETGSGRTMSSRLAPAHSEFRIRYPAFPIRRCG